jgi:hypothetical protein
VADFEERQEAEKFQKEMEEKFGSEYSFSMNKEEK